MGDVVKGLGSVASAAAPFVGMIPGVGTLASGALGGVGGLMEGKNIGQSLLQGGEDAIPGALGGMLGRGANAFTNAGEGVIGGGSGLSGLLGSGLGGIASKIGGALGNTFAPGGTPDIGKIMGAVGGISNMIGGQQQRNSAQDYANSQIDMRNKLMQQLGQSPNFALPKITPYNGGPGTAGNMQRTGPVAPNLNQQSSSTSGGY
jgi:hypothetical protein